MKLIYIIGGMCSGKSSVLRTLGSLGAHTIDFDLLATDIISSHQAYKIFKDSEFEKFFSVSGLVDKASFTEYLFSDKQALFRYNRTFFPVIKARLDECLRSIDSQIVCIEYSAWDGSPRKADVFLKDADVVVGVVCSDNIRVDRALNKFGCAEVFYDRVNLQPRIDSLVAQCDFIIDNSKGKEVLEHECRKLWTKCCE